MIMQSIDHRCWKISLFFCFRPGFTFVSAVLGVIAVTVPAPCRNTSGYYSRPVLCYITLKNVVVDLLARFFF